MERCKNCNIAGVHDGAGMICCPRCGRVLVFDMLSEETTFTATSNGQSRPDGTYTKINPTSSYQQTLLKGEHEISTMVSKLGIGGGDSIIKQAAAYHKIALDRNFTRGRLTGLITASCLYIACREEQKPYLLIDFSEVLQVNVYELGHVYLQLCQLLRLGEHSNFLIDPALFMPRFSECLLKERNVKVEKTALRILASMKRDWMQTGRKPGGLCGAALYISALSFGIKCSKSEIASVVHMCEETLTKRLIEFENTESGSLTIEELDQKSKGYGYAIENMNATAITEQALLCKHRDSGDPNFAHGLCEICYRNFVELSGGLQGGLDPPAFQRAEKQRTAKSAENIVQEPFQELDDEPGNLSDIDDDEVDMYINNQLEADMKKIIWEKMNWEYIEEQAAKEKAAKETYDSMLMKGSKETLTAEELAAAVSAAVAKSRKDKRQKKSMELKNAGPARTPAEAVAQMLKGKRLSSKINYDVLENLFDEEPTHSDDLKRKNSPYSSDDAADTQQYKKGKIEYKSVDNGNDFRVDEEFTGVEYCYEEQGPYGDQEEYYFEDYGSEI